MNGKITLEITVTICTLLGIFFGFFAITGTKSSETQNISFKVFTEKEFYLKGEPVKLKVEIFNNGKTDIKFIPPHQSRLWISRDKESYKFHDGDPRDDSNFDFSILKPEQSWSMDLLPFLWNGKPNYSHLVGNTQSFREADEKTKITSEYVFQDAGTYYATVRIKIKIEKNQEAIKTQAEPAEIIIKEPTGDDLEVWKRIEGKIDIAYLMQYGRFADVNSVNSEKQNNLFQEVEQIIINYPNSVYSKYLKSGIEKFKAENK